jgi:hypothetical protein
MANAGLNTGNLKLIGVLVFTTVTSTAATIGWANSKTGDAVEEHRVKEMHVLHPSKDSFEALHRNLERVIEQLDKQDEKIDKIAEKVGAKK